MSNKVEETAIEKQQRIDAAMLSIRKQFGDTSALMASDSGSSFLAKENVLSSGVLTLDIILNGGYPKGRMIEMFGLESSGKSTLALMACASCQKENGTVAYVDAEGAFDKDYAFFLGVDIEQLILSRPQNGEDAMDIIQELVVKDIANLIIVDSVAALVPTAEVNSSASDAHMGLQARMLAKALRKLAIPLEKNQCTILFLNQVRDCIGVIYGPKTTTPGGHSLKFGASIRIEIKRGDMIKKGTEIVGQAIRCQVVKNKTGGDPKKKCECVLMYDTGISKEEMLVAVAVQYGIIEKAGSWYSYNDVKVGQGSESVKKKLEEDRDFYKEIEKLVHEKAFYFWNKKEDTEEPKKKKKKLDK